MATLMYSFAQLEAFTAVAEHGSLMKAASKLEKDRTTLRDLIDFLEDGLGYALFLREGRHLQLTPEGEQLQRQAHLLMRQVRAFEAFARAVPDSATQDISLVYDPFTPRDFLQALIENMATQNIRLSLTSASRDEAEAMLASGEADLGICQARNRSVGNEMEWRALGAIDMDFYAATSLFARVHRRFRCSTSLWCRRSSCIRHLMSRLRVVCKSPDIPFLQMIWKCYAVCWSKGAAGDFCRPIFRRSSGKR